MLLSSPEATTSKGQALILLSPGFSSHYFSPSLKEGHLSQMRVLLALLPRLRVALSFSVTTTSHLRQSPHLPSQLQVLSSLKVISLTFFQTLPLLPSAKLLKKSHPSFSFFPQPGPTSVTATRLNPTASPVSTAFRCFSGGYFLLDCFLKLRDIVQLHTTQIQGFVPYSQIYI